MVRLSVAIMAHESREWRLAGLIDRLGKESGDVFVSVDTANAGPWFNAQQCWAATPADCTHRMILQDDVLLCRDFYAAACAAIRQRPRAAVQFYANDKRIDAARARGHAWARMPRSHFTGGVYGQVMCLPVAHVWGLLRWWDALPANLKAPRLDGKRNTVTHSCDGNLGRYVLDAGLPVWATVPSLVEHGCPTESLIGYSNRTKVARWFIGEDVSGLSVDWTAGRELGDD